MILLLCTVLCCVERTMLNGYNKKEGEGNGFSKLCCAHTVLHLLFLLCCCCSFHHSYPHYNHITRTGPLLALLTVFQEGNLEDYTAFINANGGNADTILAQWDLKAETCAKYMKILSLCSVAAAHEEIPYSVLASTLQVTPDEVEKWVVAAVSSGLLSAKMDQLQMKVIIERCVVRKFDVEQWKVLQSRLHLWKQNVGGILAAYKQSLEQAKHQPAQQ
jgi:hypothetical protein